MHLMIVTKYDISDRKRDDRSELTNTYGMGKNIYGKEYMKKTQHAFP